VTAAALARLLVAHGWDPPPWNICPPDIPGSERLCRVCGAPIDAELLGLLCRVCALDHLDAASRQRRTVQRPDGRMRLEIPWVGSPSADAIAKLARARAVTVKRPGKSGARQ
jgi:NMD protein affecting ribosome stability and mRNA decay